MSTAKELRAITEKARLQKQNEAKQGKVLREQEMEKEIAVCLNNILMEAESAAQAGNNEKCIAAIRVDLDELRGDALSFLIKQLKDRGFGVSLRREEYTDIFGLKPPAHHDIEGWEKYQNELDKRRKVFISSITISW